MLRRNSSAVEPLPIILHCIGNVMNSLVFGVTYAEDDPTWKWLQQLQDEGIKYIGVAGPLNFLPILRYVYWGCFAMLLIILRSEVLPELSVVTQIYITFMRLFHCIYT
jgi:hypothetical protein